jgi:glyoxylase-like metal-dependent hydrolase (beta-lactamase superfamily II)/predicted ester cyclase
MSASQVARRYFEALDQRDLDAATACWAPGGIDRLVGLEELVAPDGVRGYFGGLYEAFPDFKLEIIDLVPSGKRVAVRWRLRGTFAGPGTFQGFEPNGARIDLEGCDVFTVSDELIQRNDAYVNAGELARQLGVLPPAGSKAEARLARLANARTRLVSRVRRVKTERIADGVWIVRGGLPLKTFNVYLLEDDGGVTVFDGGIHDMTAALAAAAAKMGGIKRVVLGHADADHRGATPGLHVPVYCHPADRAAAESNAPYRDYFDFSKLHPHGRFLLSRLLPFWDGGAVEIEGTIEEGDQVAGFRVVHLPGHAPGQIGLFRDADRLALVSDCFYTLNVETGIKGAPRVPLDAFNIDSEQARASIRKLASLDPSEAWPGHAEPIKGDVAAALDRAAAA